MVRDPICGMDVEEGTTWSSTFDGKTYFFCCAACKATFDKGPEEWM